AGADVPKSKRFERSGLSEASAYVGFPCVLKAEGLAHKTEAGGVALNIKNDVELSDIAETMPGDAFLLEEMISGAVAELLLGITRDEAHGYVLTLGAGGTMTELMADTVSLLLPASAEDVDTALRSLKIAPLLNGYRGAPAAHMPSVLTAIQRIAGFVAAHHGRIEELEVNPLIVTPSRAVVADVLIRGER
ncbi:MAG: acetate--CoA ligase family protein, partial [Pseudomonadota bacterium]